MNSISTQTQARHRASSPLLAAALVVGSFSLSQPVMAETGGHVSVVSNYLFRGVTQTDDGPALQAALDYGSDSGLYAGTWISNVDFGGKEDAEVDLYAGLRGEVGDSGIGWDIGAIYYLYPGGGELDYGELTFGMNYGRISAGVAWTFWGEVSGSAAFDTGDVHYNLSLDLPFELAKFSFNAFAGYYDFDEDGNPEAGGELSYAHWGLAAQRDLSEFGSLSVTYEQTDGGDSNAVATDDDATVWLGWTLEF